MSFFSSLIGIDKNENEDENNNDNDKKENKKDDGKENDGITFYDYPEWEPKKIDFNKYFDMESFRKCQEKIAKKNKKWKKKLQKTNIHHSASRSLDSMRDFNNNNQDDQPFFLFRCVSPEKFNC